MSSSGTAGGRLRRSQPASAEPASEAPPSCKTSRRPRRRRRRVFPIGESLPEPSRPRHCRAMGEPTAGVARTTCERCGSFIEGQSERVRGKELCAECVGRVREERGRIGLYPVWYIWLWAVLGNGVFGAVLAGISWRRLGEPARERLCWLAAGLCAIVLFAVLFIGKHTVLILVTSVASTQAIVKGL